MKQLLPILLISTLTLAQDLSDLNNLIDIPFKPSKTSADRIQQHGYPAESHFIETEDGYRLNLFRIPYSPKLNNKNENKPIVLLQHGLLSSSDCFLLNGPDDAIAFNFADNGYDVWLGNARGNIYSRYNTKITRDQSGFWSFSWHEIGNIDMPAMIDYILHKTGQTKLHYVGHSQGCTAFFVMASTRPEYNLKIKTAHMLAPAIFMGNSTNSVLVRMAPILGKPGRASSLLSDQEFVPYNPVVQRLADSVCDSSSISQKYCFTLLLLLAGPVNDNLNKTLLPQVVETHPAGISTNQGIHYVQEYVSNEFRQFDYGRKKNMRKYGQPEPPRYQIELITSNMHIYFGLADSAAHFNDVARLRDILPNLKLFYEVPNPEWGHLDYIFANEVKEMINDPVIEMCQKYEQSEWRQ